MSDKKFMFLPNDKKLMRLESCDFHLSEGKEANQVQCTLKKIINPSLILFYYNNTSKKILTEFFKASRNETFKAGDKKDIFRDLKSEKLDDHLKFKFGSINLDYEVGLRESLQNIEVGNPFKWMEIVETSKGGEKLKYPFVVFYYQGIPQYLYEGLMSSTSLVNQFSDWYKDLMEMEEERGSKLDDKNGIYIAVDDYQISYDPDSFSSLSLENRKKTFSFIKGEIFRVMFLDEKVIFSKDLDSGTDFVFYNEEIKNGTDIIVDKFNIEDVFNKYFRKIDIDYHKKEGQDIDQEKYREMYNISHPTGVKRKKQIFLEEDFFTRGLGDEETNKRMKEMMEQGGLLKDYISDTDISNGSIREKDKIIKLGNIFDKTRNLEELMDSIRYFMKQEKGKIENAKIDSIVQIRGKLERLIEQIRNYINGMTARLESLKNTRPVLATSS